MAHTFLIFDFGTDEEAAQQARHKLEGWQQGFRLGKKLLFKFERNAAAAGDGKEGKKTGESKTGKDSKAEPEAKESIRILIRLEFSDHEKLSRQRWEQRIPSEEPFKAAKSELLHSGDKTFQSASEHFDSLN